MGISIVKKITILAHNSLREALIKELQHQGVVHITDMRGFSLEEEMAVRPRESSATKVNNLLSRLDYCIHFCGKYEQPLGLLQNLQHGTPLLSIKEADKVLQQVSFEEVYERCHQIDEKLVEISHKEGLLQTRQQFLLHWAGLSAPLEKISPTLKTTVSAYKLPVGLQEAFIAEWQQAIANSHLQLISQDNQNAYLVIIYLKAEQEKVQPLLIKYSLEAVSFIDLTGKPATIITQITTELADLAKSRKELIAEAEGLAQHKKKLQLVYDYFYNEKLRIEVQNSFIETNRTFCIDGWIRRKDLPRLQKRLQEKFQEIEIRVSEPAAEETPPVDLTNRELFAPFESVTKLYGLPSYSELDPTPVLAPFFFVFFGLCLTDGGYGIVLTLITYIALKKFLLKEGVRSILRLFF